MKSLTLSLRKLLGIIALVVLGTSGTAYGLTMLFTHTAPSVTVTTPALSTTCAGVTLIASPGSIFSGTSGTVTLQCPGPVAVFASTGGTDTPTFTLPAGYSSLTITAFVNTNSPCIAGTTLTTGVALAVPAGSYEYCLTYTNPSSGAVPSFTIAWS
jgi:hypothetical protein